MPRKSPSIAVAILCMLLATGSRADPPQGTGVPLSTLGKAVVDTNDNLTSPGAIINLFDAPKFDAHEQVEAENHLGIFPEAANRIQRIQNPILWAEPPTQFSMGCLERPSNVASQPNPKPAFIMESDSESTVRGALQTYRPSAPFTVGVEEQGLPSKKGTQSKASRIRGGHYDYYGYHLRFRRRNEGYFCEEFIDRHPCAVSCPSSVNVETGRITVGEVSIPLRNAFLRAFRRAKANAEIQGEHLAGLVYAGNVFLIAWDAPFARFVLFSIDATTGELLWESAGWAVYSKPFSQVESTEWKVTMTASSELIQVYGVTHLGNYLEDFAADTGNSHRRLSEIP